MSASATPAVGKLPQSRYGSFGFSGEKMVHPLSRLFGLIVGKPKEGKSCLIQSNPSGLVVNFDQSSTTTPTPNAQIWPGIDTKTGDPIGLDRRPLSVTWEEVRKVIDAVCDAAKAGKPCPDTIYFDSLSTWIQCLKEYLIRERASELSARDEIPVTRWQDMDGRRYWDILYDMVIGTCTRLRQHGRGVWLVCHVVDVKVPVKGQGNQDSFIIRPELNITDGFYKRLYPLFELVGCVEKRVESVAIKTKATEVTLKDGKKHTRPGMTRYEKKSKHFFTTQNADLKGIIGQRVKLPDEIEIPYEDGWRALLTAYENAAYV